VNLQYNQTVREVSKYTQFSSAADSVKAIC